MDDLGKCGVYEILNTVTGKRYVGSTSRRFRERFAEHRKQLRSRTHVNKKLQRAWNKYGEAFFEFTILEVTSPDQAVVREQHFIDLHRCVKNGYNISPKAESTRGVKHADAVKKKLSIIASNRSPETREKLSLAKRNVSDETRQRYSASAKRRAERLKQEMSAQTKSRWEDPEKRRIMTERSIAAKRNPEVIARQSEISRQQFENPNARSEASRIRKEWWNNMTDEQRQAFKEKLANARRDAIARKKQTSPVS